MKITRVSFLCCQYPLAKPISLSCGVLSSRNFGLVKIETDSGIEGWGETSINFPPWTFKERKATIEDGLAALLINENPLEIGRLWNKMYSAVRSFTRMWSEGALLQAIGGLDMALWDIAGKEYGQPVSVLMGGRYREQAEAYATGYSLEQLVSGAEDLHLKGYRVVKTRVGYDDQNDLESVRRIREALGDHIGLMVDANGAYSYPRARHMARFLSEYDLYWLEEPVLSDDVESYLALKKEFPLLPFAWGENGFSVEVYQEFVNRAAVDVVMPDPSRCGGLTQTIRLCETAWRKGIPFSPHHYGSDLGFAGALHLVASQPNFSIMLRDVSDCPLRDEIIEEPFIVTDGKVAIPNKPGLGVELNQKMVERYLV